MFIIPFNAITKGDVAQDIRLGGLGFWLEVTSLCYALWIVSGKQIMLKVSSIFIC
jgi:hypothetical protein